MPREMSGAEVAWEPRRSYQVTARRLCSRCPHPPATAELLCLHRALTCGKPTLAAPLRCKAVVDARSHPAAGPMSCDTRTRSRHPQVVQRIRGRVRLERDG